jgi:hypothetical protein
MAITTGDGVIAAAKQEVTIVKTQTATTVAAQWHTTFDRAGNPGAGTLNVGNTANGLVPTDVTAGFPLINAFGGGATGYLAAVDYASTVASRIQLYDRLFHVGSISMTALATTTLAAQPSFASRVPGGTDFGGLEIWLEFNITVSATATTVAVGYTNQAGTAGRTTGATASLSGFITGRVVKLPLQAGDSGVQQINSVTVGGTVASAGTVNVIVARRLWSGRVRLAGDGDIHGIDKTVMPVVFADSALALIVAPDSTSSGVPEVYLDIING